jgi:hypothetical protein
MVFRARGDLLLNLLRFDFTKAALGSSQVSKSSRKEQRNGKTKRKSIKLESLIFHDRNNNSRAMNKAAKEKKTQKVSLSERLSGKASS